MKEKNRKVIDIIKKKPDNVSIQEKQEEKIKLAPKGEQEVIKEEGRKIEPRNFLVKKEPAIIHKKEISHIDRPFHAKYETKGGHNRKERAKFYILLAFLVLLAVVLVYVAIFILPRAEIKITTKKIPSWEYGNPIIINPKIAEVDSETRQIPAAILSQKKNATFSWLASSDKYVEQKATGIITIYNNYNSANQVLVEGTRFQSSEGKIFRLTERTIVPGAKVENGKISASSIDANVIADKAGDSYNIGPESKFTIPGFLGIDKYEKFYGASKQPMVGGFIGQGKYPTQDDIKKAKANAETQIKEVLTSFLYSQIAGDDYKIIGSDKQFTVIKEIVNTNTDANGNFSVFIEAEASIQLFRTADFLNLMSQLAKQAKGEEYQIKSYNVDYGTISEDAKNKTITLPIKFQSVLYRPVDANDFKTKILGKSEDQLKTVVFSSSDIEKADISFWPFWVKTIPEDGNRVKVTVD